MAVHGTNESTLMTGSHMYATTTALMLKLLFSSSGVLIEQIMVRLLLQLYDSKSCDISLQGSLG